MAEVVADLKRILKHAIILQDIATENIYNSSKNQTDHHHIELIFDIGDTHL